MAGRNMVYDRLRVAPSSALTRELHPRCCPGPVKVPLGPLGASFVFAIAIVIGCSAPMVRGRGDASMEPQMDARRMDGVVDMAPAAVDSAPVPVDTAPARTVHSGDLLTGEIWGRAWGGKGSCDGQGVAISADGSIYVTGKFSGAVDFDPEETEDIRIASVGTGIFLTRFLATGSRAWTLTWTTSDGFTHSGWGNQGWAIAFGPDGSLFLGGQYSGTIDLDPHNGGAIQQMTSGFDAFLLKLMPDLSYAWGIALHNPQSAVVRSIVVEPDRIVVSGQTYSGADFDPGPGVLTLASQGQADCYLLSLSLDGDLQWAREWGGDMDEWTCKARASEGSIVVTGSFCGMGDMDPGPGEDVRYATGAIEAFLLTFDRQGSRTGISTWGNIQNTSSNDIGTWSKSVYVGGAFDQPTDFATAEPPAIRAPLSTTLAYDAYLLKFDTAGTRPWVRTWGGGTGSRAHVASVVAIDLGVIVAGHYVGAVDFGDSGGSAIYTAKGTNKTINTFVRAFDHGGNQLWTRVFPGDDNFATSVESRDGVAAVTGTLLGTVDLDLGAGPDIWSSPGLPSCYVARFLVTPPPASSPR